MSRDQTRNIETFKIGGTRVNEFEFHKNQGRLTEQFEQRSEEKTAGAKPATKAERVAELMAEAHRKVEKRKKHEAAKAGGSKKSAATKSKRKDSAKRQVSQAASTGSTGANVASKQSSSERKSRAKSAKKT